MPRKCQHCNKRNCNGQCRQRNSNSGADFLSAAASGVLALGAVAAGAFLVNEIIESDARNTRRHQHRRRQRQQLTNRTNVHVHPEVEPVSAIQSSTQYATQSGNIPILQAPGNVSANVYRKPAATSTPTTKPKPSKDAAAAVQTTCIICLDAPSSYAFVPCGHFVVCGQCLNAYPSRRCPICKANIDGAMRIFQ